MWVLVLHEALYIEHCHPHIVKLHINMTVVFLQEKEKKDDDDANEFVSAVCWRPVSAVPKTQSRV